MKKWIRKWLGIPDQITHAPSDEWLAKYSDVFEMYRCTRGELNGALAQLNRLNSEEFIDQVVERIKRKQL
jgi:hypothetical protein